MDVGDGVGIATAKWSEADSSAARYFKFYSIARKFQGGPSVTSIGNSVSSGYGLSRAAEKPGRDGSGIKNPPQLKNALTTRFFVL